MGTSTSAAQLSQKITKMATVTQRRQREVVNQGALTAKEIMLAEAASRGISPGSRIAGGKWGVGYDVKGFNNPTALVRYRGPFHLVDNPTKAHFITPKGFGGGRKKRGQRAMGAALMGTFGLSGRGAFAGRGRHSIIVKGEHAAYARHPGTKGKKSFPAAKKKAKRAVPIVMSRSVIGGWRSALR